MAGPTNGITANCSLSVLFFWKERLFDCPDQDSARGTFSTRHAILYDGKNRCAVCAADAFGEKQARICIYNSLLSEAASSGSIRLFARLSSMLCLWEAQFGDFSMARKPSRPIHRFARNRKWQRPSGIVLLLPHGYEGQGPNIPAAGFERFFNLCEDNIQVCNCNYCGAVLSPAPPANETRLHQAARDHDTEEFIARPNLRRRRERIYQWQVRGNSRFSRSGPPTK